MESIKNKDKKYYIDALFENVSWAYEAPKSELVVISKEDVPFEKKEILASLKDFVHTSALENKVQFSGGEIRLKPAIKSCETQSDLLAVWEDLSKSFSEEFALTSKIIHELKNGPIKVLFVGDFPKEDEQVFGGKVRELLLKMISAMKLGEHDFALTSIVKHSKLPEGKLKDLGRDSLSLLHHEICYYKAQIVVCLGAFSSSLLLGTEDRLTAIHGEFFEKEIQADNGTNHKYLIMPIFHPEFLLINPNMKKTTWTDLQKAMKTLGLL